MFGILGDHGPLAPKSALAFVRNSFAINCTSIVEKFLLRSEGSEATSVDVYHPCYKRRQKAEIENGRYCKTLLNDYRCTVAVMQENSNSIFGKVGRRPIASEEVSCPAPYFMPILLYGLEALPLNKSQLSSLDIMVNLFLMKLFTRFCQLQFFRYQ